MLKKTLLTSTNIRCHPKGKNPLDSKGNITWCSLCQSVNHWAQDCPDKTDSPNNTWLSYEAILFQEDSDHPSEIKGLLLESRNAAVLDCGVSKTICDWLRLDSYIDSLSEVQKANTVFQTSSSIYRFGHGKTFKATKKTQIPAEIGSHNVLIEKDVINSDIPLLLSWASMKQADMNLNFKDNTASVLDKTIELVVIRSGHYVIPLTVPCQIIHSWNANVNVILTVQTNLDKEKMAQKSHWQFGHESSEKLLRLVNSGGLTWSQQSKLREKITLICKNCPVCLIYKKTPPRPIADLPFTTKFKECVAIDQKFYKGNTFLQHMINHSARLSVTVILPSNKPDQIVN